MSQPLDGERTVSDVAKGKKPWFTPTRKAGAIAIGATVVVGFILWKDPGRKKEDPEPPPPTTGISQTVVYDPPKPQPMPAAYQPVMVPTPASPPPQPPQAEPPRSALTMPVTPPLPALPQPRRPRMLSYATEAAPGTERQANNGSGAGGGVADPAQGGTHVTYKAAEIVGGKAGAAMDRDLLLMPGIIQCVLDTGINSTLPGPLLCHLDQPVISPGNVVLMEKGTQIIGSYSSDVKQGQYRMMAVTATAYTPNGVPVPLGGPFADGLGVTGLEADMVDNHLMQRFGGAVLLSIAEGGLGIAQSAVSKGGNSYVSFSSGGVGSLAQEVLQNTINIPPTIQKYAGDSISLWVLTPIDFSASYKLRSIH
jgi:type IV secretion system protein VirB10